MGKILKTCFEIFYPPPPPPPQWGPLLGWVSTSWGGVKNFKTRFQNFFQNKSCSLEPPGTSHPTDLLVWSRIKSYNRDNTALWSLLARKWQKMAIFGHFWPSTVGIGTQTPKTKISTSPEKVFPTGLYLGMGGFDNF